MLHHPSLHQCYGRIANDQGLDPLRLDPSPPASPASDNLVSLLEGALSFAIFTVPLLLSGVLPHAVLQSPHPCGDAYPATTEISVNGLAVVAAPGILGMVLRKAVAIADVRALDAVQRHVHGADAQHRGVEVEAVEQARVEVRRSLSSRKKERSDVCADTPRPRPGNRRFHRRGRRLRPPAWAVPAPPSSR